MKKTRLAQLREALQGGATLTSGMIRTRYKLASPTKAISTLREKGHIIVANTLSKNGNVLYRKPAWAHDMTGVS